MLVPRREPEASEVGRKILIDLDETFFFFTFFGWLFRVCLEKF